ncbi:post-GPI attachment to proteins factor 3-like [Mya arenaria]|uniref:post-GPI attachment to proteins factor 3-like n=1 Tax=Mya arenaria TaxID=6604 RepID=UPI0022E419EE|nr:post-GPI attachment to proteins factor 3-like [Mya arenaria]XP_052801835.1 post-GPI attachment to proteins factor 3-like [Mya arenaria]XP_052801843.1 post-GPI attachment to proteins factor 3-like [Mya arenaria]XP_052801853.1 post-GPI attachment to proteins factor 3-like [Mya arenaria]
MLYQTSLHVVGLLFMVAMVTGSPGDRSYVYQKCLHSCVQKNCSEYKINSFLESQPACTRLMGWSCQDECKYTCMWVAADAFEKDGLHVPQFHGKWPFIRLCGIQEPASMFFSLLNGLAHLSILWYRRFVPPSTPMYYVWHSVALLAFNAWTWSVIFHTKDTDFTEKMDYFCAFSMVIYNTFTVACRILGTHNWRPLAFIALFCGAFFIQHITYLSIYGFGYGYNMKVNISVAVFNMVCWVYLCYKIRRWFVWKAIISIVGIQALLALELWDFPPLFWTFDAHSLWHAGSWPLCILWYSFLIDDSLHMMKDKTASLLPHSQKTD